MATKKLSMDEVIATEMPGFRVVKEAAADAAADAAGYEPDAVTPSLESMQAKYKMKGANPAKRAGAKRDSISSSKSQMVVVESTPGPGNSDAPGKRLTVLVKDGKIRARQG